MLATDGSGRACAAGGGKAKRTRSQHARVGRPAVDPTGRRAKFTEEIKHLSRAKDDMGVEQTFLQDKFRQMRHENDRLKTDIDTFKGRLGNATEDYVRVAPRVHAPFC
jgi:hypothetical protein